jgi:uncharacterized repeat protein (TIGR01451 family)
MKSLAFLAGFGLLAVVLCRVGANEPPLLGPAPPLIVPIPPAPDCPPDPPPPVVKVKVRVPAFSAPGEPIEYRICVENCSPAEAHHVLLKNPLPANARFVRADPEPTAMVPELRWDLGTVGGGACREVILVLRPTNREDVKNCTRVQFEHGQCVTTHQAGFGPGFVPGFVPGVEPPVMPTIPEEDRPKLALTIEGHKRQYVNLGSHYFITVKNNGKTRAGNLLVSCALPEQMKFVRASHNWKYAQGQVAWVLGDLDPGAQRTVELVAKAQREGEFCVRATARADLGAAATAEACTQFLGVSALHVEMTDRDDPLVVGGKTSYPILIRNQGSAPVTNLRLKALIPPALQLLDVKGPTKFQLGEKTDKGQWVEMAPIAKLEAMTNQTYEIFVEARRAGETRVHIEVSADQLERGPVIEEESTTLFEEDVPVKVKGKR